MAVAATTQQSAAAPVESARNASVCREHSCVRCSASIASTEPCTFVPSVRTVCRLCRSQEQVLSHLPAGRTSWSASLARARH